MLSMQYVRLVIKVKVEIPESFKLGWYPHKITGSSHLNGGFFALRFGGGGGRGAYTWRGLFSEFFGNLSKK